MLASNESGCAFRLNPELRGNDPLPDIDLLKVVETPAPWLVSFLEALASKNLLLVGRTEAKGFVGIIAFVMLMIAVLTVVMTMILMGGNQL
jgi:hypothetical protein